MPLENGSWRETTEEDLKIFEESLSGLKEVTGLTPELEERLERAVSKTQDMGPSLAALIEGNQRLYVQLWNALGKPGGSVDIIVPVFNAWHVTRRCLGSVLLHTTWPNKLIVVDDASDEYTQQQLRGYAPPELMTVLRNEKNRGFAATVNRGIRAGTGEYVCLLNSDVMVTYRWLTKMVFALLADERNAIVCPATNNTAVVDVPMSPGASYLQMNQALQVFAQRRYPEILPTGFCFLFRRSLLDEIGYFDEAYKNFGEETQFWWDAIKAGHRAVMADDTYVFHERASSYSALGADAHMAFRKHASGRFNQLNPEWVKWRDHYDARKALGPLRQPVPPSFLRSPKDLYRVCWIVRDARACGAMRYIADLCNELNERGANAKVVVVPRDGAKVPEEWLGELRSAPVFFRDEREFLEEFPRRVFPNGLVIAATVELAPAVQALVDAGGGRIRGCLHAQSFDPALAKSEQDIEHLKALYKLLPDVISSSAWVAQEIAACGPTPFATIHPGVDRTLFYPRDRSQGDERPTVMVPMNPSVWWRGWDRGLELIQELDRQATERGIELRILVYGVDELPIKSRAICLGVISQARLATLLGCEADLLVDPSYVHSYGMPVLEAAASNVLVRSWENRGQAETDLADPFDGSPADMAENVVEALQRYLAAGRMNFNTLGISLGIAEHHDREKSVSAWISAVEKHFKLLRKHRSICMVVPHLRKWGGPTTMLMIANELAKRGHTVQVVTVYEDIHPGIAALSDVPISKGPDLPRADLYITNSDNPWVERIASMPREQHCILLKLSHNPRFRKEEERGLKQDWDAVVTSTQWLADACKVPTEGWDFPMTDADVIGWWHYEHARFRCPPSERTYGDGSAERPFVIGTLIHAHPTKGTREALDALAKLPAEYHYRFIGVGEVPPRGVRLPESFEYVYDPSRDRLAEVMRGLDIWVSASHSEGLGRMTLEAMSAGVTVVSSTGAEFGALRLDMLEYSVRNHAELLDYRNSCFETAERAADPEPCINALEVIIERVFA